MKTTNLWQIWFQFHNSFTSNEQRITNLDSETKSFSPRVSRVEYCKWSVKGESFSKAQYMEQKFTSKSCVFDSFPIDMGDWAAILEACCRHQKLQTKFPSCSNKRVQRIIQPRGENCDKQRCVFRGNDRTRTQNLLKFNWKFSQQWKAAIRSSYILRKRKKKS